VDVICLSQVLQVQPTCNDLHEILGKENRLRLHNQQSGGKIMVQVLRMGKEYRSKSSAQNLEKKVVSSKSLVHTYPTKQVKKG
jgi:hypothetical protein